MTQPVARDATESSRASAMATALPDAEPPAISLEETLWRATLRRNGRPRDRRVGVAGRCVRSWCLDCIAIVA